MAIVKLATGIYRDDASNWAIVRYRIDGQDFARKFRHKTPLAVLRAARRELIALARAKAEADRQARSEAAAILGRSGGLRRAAVLTAAERSAIASKAGKLGGWPKGRKRGPRAPKGGAPNA